MKHLYFILLALLLGSNSAHSDILHPVVDSITMSDGRKLAADVYIPSGITHGPVILIQTPYNRQLYRNSLPLEVGINLNSSNYIFVIVDWRGFYGSAAAAYVSSPTLGQDGYDCVEWVAQQSFSNGKVGTWGASALGRVQFQTAEQNPPHLVCICPLVAGPQYSYEEYFPNGDLRTEYVEQLNGLGFGIGTAIMPHPTHDVTWTFVENANFYPDSIRVPCYMIGGWYDHTIQDMLTFFPAIQIQSPVDVRSQHRLLMGPWVHTNIGGLDQGQLTYPDALNWSDSLALRFFDYHLRNISNNWDQSPVVQYYQMGENTWQNSPVWPPAGTLNTNFYFQPDGSLSASLPTGVNDSLSYAYDPNNPSPTIGGPTLRTDLEKGPCDQSDTVEGRNDITTFTTPALPQDMLMRGNVVVHLKVSSNRFDTDFDIRLTDVYPDGRSMLVNDGNMRMRFRNGEAPADTSHITPGQVYDCVITLPNTAITFLAGHKVRVDVTSSNYPRFNRNANADGVMYPGNSLDSLQNPLVATNTVYTNSSNASYITLPLVNVTGIDEIASGPVINIYPNPSSGLVNIEVGNSQSYQLRLINSVGNVMFQQQITGRSILDLSSFLDGIYFAEFTDKATSQVICKKLVK